MGRGALRTPTSLSGLIRTRERVRTQQNARDTTGTTNAISFAPSRHSGTTVGSIFACRGAQHATNPLDSGFAMGDGKLTLMRIIQVRYTTSEFAFLSACHIAVGDASTPDEVQCAGFSGGN